MLAFSDVYGDDFHVPGWLAFLHFTHFILAALDVRLHLHVPTALYW